MALAPPQVGPAPRREGEVLVRFRADAPAEQVDAAARARGARRKRVLRGASRVEALALDPGLTPEAVASSLLSDPAVELAEPNYLIAKDGLPPNDARFSEQWALENNGQTGGTSGSDVAVAGAWRTTTGASSTVIAVIDSGIDFNHPDLRGNRWRNDRERENGRDDDRNGYPDDLHGWDWVADAGTVHDRNGHGTSVAGIIAAEGDNRIGTAGVMWRAGLMSLGVLDAAGTGDVAAAVEAIDYAVAHGAQVINCSWGTEAASQALRDAVERAGRRGVVVVASAGNGSRDIEGLPYYPASFDLPNLITVAATDQFDNLAPFSNWGVARVTVAAPGADILTTKAGGDYWTVGGTSASAPLVTGIAGLVKTVRPWLSASGTRQAVVDGARRLATLDGKVSSGGVASASGALGALHSPRPGDGSGNGGGHGEGNRSGNGNGQGIGRPHPAGRNDGRHVGRRAPTSPAPSDGQGGPNLDEVRNRPSHQPEPPPAPIRANQPMICDCYEAGGSDPEFSNARALPENETGEPGEDLGSKNFNWAAPLVSLPGRAGLDLNLALTYNSLVWTKDQNAIMFNADYGFPSPGFRLGFPHIQKWFVDSEAMNDAYMMLTPAGGRVKLRRVGTTNTYEATDGSYTQLLDYGAGGALVRTTDGTQYSFENTANGEKRCREIKDRNGNFITITYDDAGRIQGVTDTLGRVVNFVYDGGGNLFRLTQSRGGSGHTDLLAQFAYGSQPLQPSFGGGVGTVHGPVGQPIPVLTQVWVPDGVTYNFEYTVYGQVWRVSRNAPDGTLLSSVGYNLPGSAWAGVSPQGDCPRYTERRDWVKHGVMQQDATVTTSFSSAADGSWSQVRTPDGMVYKEYFYSSGWERGLTYQTEVFHEGSPAAVKKKTTTAWTHDFAGQHSQPYAKNPRPYEINVYDEGNVNRRRTTIEYIEGYSLPTHVREWAGADGQTLLRLSATAYRGGDYINRRIIGLPHEKLVYDGPTGAVMSRVIFHYDWDAAYLSPQAPSTQHDSANYSSSFITGRGNLIGIRRYNCATLATAYDDNSSVWVSQSGYNAAGSPVWARDADGHQTNISYADSFSDTSKNGLNTFAYPTSVTDAEGYQATTKYNYATGAVIETRRPSSGTSAQNNVTHETLAYLYDWSARLQRVTNQNSNFYTRFEYPAGMSHVSRYSNVKPGQPEDFSAEIFDGAGRVRRFARFMPGQTDRYSGVIFHYDSMGRVVKRSKPTDVLGDWTPAGSDAAGGLVYTDQDYDWQGRPTLTTRPDGYTVLLSYSSCGCAGGDVVTVKDEAGRRRKLYKDTLGRLTKVEELNWDQSVYATTNYEYNVRDQLTQINQQGLVRTFEYDGHGRLWKRTTPEQGQTEYAYNADDSVEWTRDARGAKTNFVYSPRHLVTSISYDLSGVVTGQDVQPTSDVTYAYDAAGNRTQMTDGLGSAAYAYDSLSRLTSETRTFSGVGTFGLSYDYDNAGLSSITNPWGSQVGYTHDHTGTLTAVTGAGPVSAPAYAQNMQYRAFGGLKEATYGNARQLSINYDARMRPVQWNVSGVMGSEYRYDYFHEHTDKVTFARDLYDPTLHRSYEYDQAGRISWAFTGAEAEAHAYSGQWGVKNGPYAHAYFYDVYGNITGRIGDGGWNPSYSASFNNNRRNDLIYDLAGNFTGGGHALYDATGQHVSYPAGGMSHSFDGDRLRLKKVEGGAATYYLRSSVLGGQVVAEVNSSGGWVRGYVYAGGRALAAQEGGTLHWVHEDPVTKTKRMTSAAGAVTSSTVLDPWGGEAAGRWALNTSQQRRKYTTYERDADGGDEAMRRRYSAWWARFSQPDPYDGSYDLSDPRSLNRYSYTQNDPVNFTDPTGLDAVGDGSFTCQPGQPCAIGSINVFGGEGGLGSALAAARLGREQGLIITEFEPRANGRLGGVPHRATPQEKPQLERNLSHDTRNFDIWNKCLIEAGADQLGITEALVALANTPVPKNWLRVPTLRGASNVTNPISAAGHLYARGANLPFKVLGTNRIFGIAGRVMPYVAVGVTVYDVARILEKANACYEKQAR